MSMDPNGGNAPTPKVEDTDAGPSRDAGRDETIMERLEKNPENSHARLDRALDESMDASDPPSTTQPNHSHDPAPSSGFDPDAEKRLADQG